MKWFALLCFLLEMGCSRLAALESYRYRCNSDSECAEGFVCRTQTCVSASNGDAGESAVGDGGPEVGIDGGADSGFWLDGGADSGSSDGGFVECGALGACLNGETCAGDNECRSRFCVSGLCCDSRCSGGCETCGADESRGVCRVRPAGTSCGATVCDGRSGVCPTECISGDGCAKTYGCCTASGSANEACRAQGRVRQCVQFPSVGSFTDDFSGIDGGLPGVLWEPFGITSTEQVFVSDNHLVVFGGDGGSSIRTVGVLLRPAASFWGSSCSIELVDTSDVAGVGSFSQTKLGLEDRARRWEFYEITVADGFLGVGIGYPQQPRYLGVAPFNPATMRFLRMREANGTVFFEYSADGGSYTLAYSASVPDGGNPADIYCYLGMYIENPTRPGPRIVFDNFNLPR